MQLDVQLLGDASKNLLVWVRGEADGMDPPFEPIEFLDLEKVASSAAGRRPKTLVLCSALWTLQEKLGLYVWTSKERGPDHLLLLMESRNFIRSDRGIILDKWEGKLYLEAFNVPELKRFWFQLDFDKAFER